MPDCALPVFDLRQPEFDPMALAKAWREHGGCGLTGVAIPPELRQAAFAQIRACFDLPLAQKQRYHVSRNYPAKRGYSGLGEEQTGYSQGPDYKEIFDLDMDAAEESEFYRRWPPLTPQFQPTLLACHQLLWPLARHLLRLLAQGCGQAEDYFERQARQLSGNLRLLRYPPNAPEESWSCAAHTDQGWLTLIAQDTPGLQIQHNGWHDAPSSDMLWLAHGGDWLERASGGVYRALPHRVAHTGSEPRHALVFFLDPGYAERLAQAQAELARESRYLFGSTYST